MNGYFFYLPWVWEAGPAAAGLCFFTLAMLFFVVGFWGATIFKRFGTAVLTTVIFGISLILLGLLWFVGQQNAWSDLFSWIMTTGALGLTLWGFALIAVLAGTSYLTLRRATP